MNKIDAKSESWIRKNFRLFSPEVKQMAGKRLNICQECPEFRQSINQCKQCGCIMPIKVFFTGAECPINRWGKEEF